MGMLCLILFLVAVSLWFFTNEYSTLSGVYAPTCAMRGRDFNWVVFVCLLSALWLSGRGSVEESVYDHLGLFPIDCRSMVVILLSSFIVLVTMSLFKVKGSATYAVLGSIGACWLINGSGSGPDWHFILSFFAAPAMALVLSAVIRHAFSFIMSRVHVHMITLSYYMRYAVIMCIVLTVCAVGLNWGGLLCGIGYMMHDESVVAVAVVIVAAVVMAAFQRFTKAENEEASGAFSDLSIYAVVSVGLSVAATMLFFSFETTAAVLHLCPVPLSVSSLVVASVAGAEIAQRSRLIDDSEYVKEAVAMAVSPVGSFMLSYLFLYLIGRGAEDAMVGFVVMAAAMLVLVSLAFAGYAKGQSRQKEAMDSILYAQRQQIYEHSRALSDMELKVVLSENQALHDAVEQKRQEVMNVALSIVEQREFLESLNEMVKEITKEDDPKRKDILIAELASSIKQRLSYDRDVDSQYFYAQAETLHEDFNAKLSENFPNLTQQERRLATLLRLGFSSKYIATLMNITSKSVEISRYRLRQKLGLEKGDNLVNFIKSI